MKATELLQRQHRDLEALLEQLRTAGQGEERNVRQELAANLVAHTLIEEEHFYPAVQEALPEEILEAFEEHGLAEVQLARLLSSRGGDEASEAKLAVLSDLLIRHIRREETDVFRAADHELADDAQEQLAEKMLARFRQVMDVGYTKLLQKALEAEVPRTPTRTAAAKKPATARRAPRTSAAKKKAAPKARAAAQRAPAKRASTKRGAAPAPRKSPKQARATRGSAGSRTRA